MNGTDSRLEVVLASVNLVVCEEMKLRVVLKERGEMSKELRCQWPCNDI